MFCFAIVIHFEPTGHTLRHNERLLDPSKIDVNKKYRESLERGVGGHENDNDGLPPYILKGSPEEARWRRLHPAGTTQQKQKSFTTGSTSAHEYAQEGDIEGLTREISRDKSVVNARDANGWTPLHESVRGGHIDAIKLLVEHGADVNSKTNMDGATPLWWAKQEWGEDSAVYELLTGLGAIMEGPEL
jgi:Ankyrin repeats (3 copies)